MRYKIKESCSCGAILEYEDTPDQPYFSHLDYVQKAFEKAHEKCKLPPRGKEKG